MLFKSYIFIKDEERTAEQKVMLQRPTIIGAIIFLSGILFFYLEIMWVGVLLVIAGLTTHFVGQWRQMKAKDKGSIPGTLTISNNEIILNDLHLEIESFKNLSFSIIDYEDGPGYSRYEAAQGNRNEIRFDLNGKLVKYNFFIQNGKQYHDLIAFCDEKNIDYVANKGIFY